MQQLHHGKQAIILGKWLLTNNLVIKLENVTHNKIENIKGITTKRQFAVSGNFISGKRQFS